MEKQMRPVGYEFYLDGLKKAGLENKAFLQRRDFNHIGQIGGIGLTLGRAGPLVARRA